MGVSVGKEVGVSVGRGVSVCVTWGMVELGIAVTSKGDDTDSGAAGSVHAEKPKMMVNAVICNRIL